MVLTAFKSIRARKLTTSEKEAHRALAAARAPVEHGFAHLENWQIPTVLRTDPDGAIGLLRALFVLNTSMTSPNDPHATTVTNYFKRAQLH